MITNTVAERIKQYALEKYPEEMCGVISGGEFFPMRNIAENTLECFRIDEKELLRYSQIDAIVHSHPNGPEYPSKEDMARQIESNTPWGLINVGAHGWVGEPFFWGDSLPVIPLVGRPFRYGPSGTDGKGDCYSLIRDYFWLEKGIRLKEFPREWDWWFHGEDMYNALFADAGFKEIRASEAKPGDVFFMVISAPVANHGGILVEEEMILHHLANRLSRKEPFGRWSKFVTRWVRYCE
jgi:proteasome lid subunit RPN8/RPN11